MPIPNKCTANYDPVCACDLETTFPNECAAHSANPPQNVAQEGRCETDEPTFSPTTTKPSNSCGQHCEKDSDCFHGGFVQCGHCDLTYAGTQTYKTCIEKPITPEPSISPIETPTTPEPSPQPITPAPITSEPIETPAPVTPAPITPVPIKTPAPTPLPTPQVRNPFSKLYDDLLDIV